MKQETINRIKFLLDMATTGPWEMHVNAGYNGIMSGATPLFLADGALMADASLVCMLVNHAQELFDEIERLQRENKQIKTNADASAISDAYKHQKNVSALLKMDVLAANAALKDATQKLKELNIENAELIAKFAPR